MTFTWAVLQRAIPEKWVSTGALCVILILGGWYARGFMQMNMQIPRRLAAIDSTNAAQDRLLEQHSARLDTIDTEVGDVYGYLEKLLCIIESQEGRRDREECNRIQIQRRTR